MTNVNAEITIEDAIRRCLDEGSPELLQKISELYREQEHLLESKYLLYKMIIRHRIMGDTKGSLRSFLVSQ